MILAYDGTTVRVESGDRASLSWLREFLIPAFSVVEGVAADCSVELVMDDRAYAGMLAGGQRVSRQIASFALERGTVRLPLWALTPHERILYDAAARVFYCVDNDGTHVRVISAAHHLAARFAVMRVVREYAMNAAQTARGLLIHGAAFAAAVGGIILAGVKAAGKTSLLIHALRAGGARFVSNDRVAVRVGDAEVVQRGMPTVVTIRPQTLTLFPDLQTALLRRFGIVRYHFRSLHRAAIAADRSGPFANIVFDSARARSSSGVSAGITGISARQHSRGAHQSRAYLMSKP
ncbi:MAG: hypothetical protein HY269_03795 [Deltaproteobacteria bacterium]|nr:hypothetical protein [Deltaproteobacteria bacterium]